MPNLDAMLATGATMRRLDHWTSRGWLIAVTANPGSGHARQWLAGEDEVAARMVRLVDEAGLRPKVAAAVARAEVRCPVCAVVQMAEVG